MSGDPQESPYVEPDPISEIAEDMAEVASENNESAQDTYDSWVAFNEDSQADDNASSVPSPYDGK